MSRAATPKPTDAELAILRILWDRGPSTVRHVHEILAHDRPAAYTTALKLLQIMTEKGLVERDERDRTHVYRARLSEEVTQRQLVRDLLDRAFGGSSGKLVMQALATRRASAQELKDIRKAIDVARTEKLDVARTEKLDVARTEKSDAARTEKLDAAKDPREVRHVDDAARD